MELPKIYDVHESEKKWQIYWKNEKIYSFDKEDMETEVYSIDTPPPTVSGKMHLGHSFSYSQQDFIARYKRMKGFNVFYPFGTDDNGLPTKLLVEKEKKVRAIDMPRKDFIRLCLKTLKEELRPSYVADWKRIGMSCDFEMFYTTINDHCQKISQKSFLDLYAIGRQYRKLAPAMYCPKCATAISQVECEDKELASHFNDIVFKVDGEELIIATTRPELLPACVGVFYHPDDKRYQHLKGKKAMVPVFDYEVPIMEDHRADPEKGTGIVMCCTFGDATDMEWQKAHSLPIKEAIDINGRMTELAQDFKGMKIEAARKGIIEAMKEKGLLKGQKPITHAVNVHERCGTPIEFIHSKQWFVKYLDLKEDMLRWGAELKWYPEHMKNRYDNWVNGLQWDWCISRQLPYGIPFPCWYCKDCDEVIVAKEKDLPVDPLEDKPPASKCPKCGCKEFIGEKDIINTWATSSLSPQIGAALIPERYDDLYPATLRPQAHDIISFWLFNTLVKSQLHNGFNPWKETTISGWALDPHGKKMSKSKGNVIAPQEMIEKYSADALRYWAAGSKLGEDMPFQEKDLVTGKKTTTKLWNASKFALMHLEDFKYDKHELEIMDKWLLTKLQKLIRSATESFDVYEYSKVKADVDNFFWNTFCDHYLEVVKDRLYNPEKYHEGARESAQFGLYEGLLNTLKMFAPVMPFITEEIYHLYFAEKEGKKSIHISSWPEYDENYVFTEAENAGDHAVDIIAAVRKFKSENQMSLKTELKELVIECDESTRKLIELVLSDIMATTGAQDIVFGDGDIAVNEKVKIRAEK